MPVTPLTLESFRLKNFKAVRDTGPLKFTPFTVLIGANGSGKSSLLEGMEVFYALGTSDVDTIFNEPRWRGFHHVWNKAIPRPDDGDDDAQPCRQSPMVFEAVINRLPLVRRYEIRTEITQADDGEVLICSERVLRDRELFERGENGRITRAETALLKLARKLAKPPAVQSATAKAKLPLFLRKLDVGVSILSSGMVRPFGKWQFLNMHSGLMGQPTIRLGGRSSRLLDTDGSNLADVVRNLGAEGLERLVSGLQQVLDYARDLQVDQFSPVDRTVYLKLKEGDFEVPGWLLSGGTVRIVAILASLYCKEPPPLLVIEEIENGLDPRTVGFLVNQMRDAVQEGKTQIIVTTHSPHFLSQASLEHLLLCQRTTDGEPKFWRPADSKELQKWSEDFNPGELFATGRIQKEMKKAVGEK